MKNVLTLNEASLRNLVKEAVTEYLSNEGVGQQIKLGKQLALPEINDLASNMDKNNLDLLRNAYKAKYGIFVNAGPDSYVKRYIICKGQEPVSYIKQDATGKYSVLPWAYVEDDGTEESLFLTK